MDFLPSPSKRNRARRGLMGAASFLLVFLTSLYVFGIMPFVGLARSYATQDYDYPIIDGLGGYRGGSVAGSFVPGSDVVARFHAAYQALQALRDSQAGGSSANSSSEASSRVASSAEGSSSGSSLADEDVLPQAACPAELQLGSRPALHRPALYGNTCEPWVGRRAVLLLQLLLSPGMKGLEWGAGSSTPWYFSRLGRLVSIEHSQDWANQVRALMRRTFDPSTLEARWELHVEPPRGQVLTFGDAESYERFKPYVDASFLEQDGGHARFDFIAIDGQARLACFQRALWMLKSHGGVLMLNSAQRRPYKEVRSLTPKHWLQFEDSSVLGTTLIWVSCQAGRCL